MDVTKKMTAQWSKVGILGVGLLGGSVAKAVRSIFPEVQICGWGRSQDNLERAIELNIIDEGSLELQDAVERADLLVVATPVQKIVETLNLAAPLLDPGCLIVDVGSTKATIVAQASGLPWSHQFCPCHPIAGSEKSGAQHASSDLFRGKTVVLTPMDSTSPKTVAGADLLWRLMGASTVYMTPDAHDAALATTSHLPHMIAAALALGTSSDLLPLVGSGWSDTTRVAAGDPALWRQIIQENQTDALHTMRRFATIWANMIDAVQREDFDAIEKMLEEGKQIRDAVGNRHTSGK